MTMLDRMRRHKSWLKWSLGLVVLAFVIFYIPDFLQDPSVDLAATDTVAVVDGREITGDEFRRSYQAQIQAYRAAYGGNMSEALLRQLGVEQQILQQMVDERAAVAEAERLDIRVSDEEVRAQILAFPAFQENGAFIGEERYLQLLSMQNPPMTPRQFEESVRRAMTVDKLRALVTDWLSIPDAELEQEYRRRNDQVKLALVPFPTDSFRASVTVADQEIAAHFEANPETFRIPEKRQIRYVLIDVEAMRAKTVVSPADVERAYNDRFEEFSTPEQVRASHILLTLEGKDEAAVSAQAAELVSKARGGADFAALAKEFSEDEASAVNGGDLDYFGRGRMVPEFDAAAFALEPGQVSDPVKTTYGFHIIQLTDKKPVITQSLEEVRPQLSEQIALERAQEQAIDLAENLERLIGSAADLDRVAAAQGLTVQETGFFARDEPIFTLGAAPELADRVFSLEQGEVTGAMPSARGFVVGALVATQPSYVPKLEEVTERVREEVTRTKAREMGRQRATELAAKLEGTTTFVQAAKAAGFEAVTTELLTRESPVPGLGNAPEVLDAAFALPQGAVSDALFAETGAAVLTVLEKREATADELTSNKDRFREELLADRRNRFFGAYMVKAKQNMRIEINRDALQRMVG